MHSSRPPEVGDVIAGRYELVDEIGRGGFGIIFRARQDRKPREVAIKLMSYTGSDLGPEEMKKRYRREAIMASNLVHPHTVQQLDFGDHGDLFYISMELLQGQTLGDRIAEKGPLPTDLITRIGRAVLDVLCFAHQKDIVHRDLKPENIMLCTVKGVDDVPKVLDFGAAKTMHGQHDLTSVGTALGSPAYMSPEVLRGESPVPASDLYSLGLTLGEAITGQKVVPGNTAIDRAKAQISPEPLELDDTLRNHELYPWLVGALQKDTNRRYESARAMLRALDQLDIGQTPTDTGAQSQHAGAVDATMPMQRANRSQAPPAMPDDDISADATLMMDAAASPDDDAQADEHPTETLEVPPQLQNRGPRSPQSSTPPPDFEAAKTESFENPFSSPSDPEVSDTDATTDQIDISGTSDSATDGTDEADSGYGASFVSDQKRSPQQTDRSQSQYSDEDFEPTADKDFRLVKTSDGRKDRLFLPALVVGAVLLVMAYLLVSSIAPT